MGCCASTGSRGSGGKKRTRRTFSDHVSAFHHTSSVPNRIFANGKSRSSCIFTQQGRKGINQDAMIVWEDFMAEDVTFCGVFDGHGPHGHLVARKVRDTLPVKLFSFLDSYESKKKGSTTSICCNGDNHGLEGDDCEEEKPELLWREAFLKSYKAMDKELKSHPNLDCFCSGSTAVTIVKQGSNLFMGSIGDSRAIMASKDTNNSLVAIQLTIDLKPDLPREAERIKKCKGRVFALQDEPEVPRVWLPFDDAPGLAMARAFGDFCLKEYGVISIPEVSHRILTESDKFIVLASDGDGFDRLSKAIFDEANAEGIHVFLHRQAIKMESLFRIVSPFCIWDVLSNEQVIEIVSSSPTRSTAARMLVDSAAREWKSKYPTSKMDDCAVVCLFLDGKMDSESDNEEHGFSSATLQSIAGESDDGQNPEPVLQRNFTVRSAEESRKDQNDVVLEGNGENETGVVEDQNWSGLEGVTRVNSLVQLPRFSEEQPRT